MIVRRLALIGSHGGLSTSMGCGAWEVVYVVRKYKGFQEEGGCVHDLKTEAHNVSGNNEEAMVTKIRT